MLNGMSAKKSTGTPVKATRYPAGPKALGVEVIEQFEKKPRLMSNPKKQDDRKGSYHC